MLLFRMVIRKRTIISFILNISVLCVGIKTKFHIDKVMQSNIEMKVLMHIIGKQKHNMVIYELEFGIAKCNLMIKVNKHYKMKKR